MSHHWAKREKLIASLDSQGKYAHYLWYLALVFILIGVIGDAANHTPGLEPSNWFLLAIATFLASITMFIGWAMAWYLKTTETKKKE